MLDIIALEALTDNYIWVISEDNDTRVAVVDPGEAAPVLAYLDDHGFALGSILLTHHHPDHTGGVNELLLTADVPVYGPAEAAHITHVTQQIGDGDRFLLDWLNLEFEVLSVPGHTADHIALYGGGLLFSGDTLFRGGCGRLFEGSPAQMRASLDRLRCLPDNTLVYCGHEYTQKNLQFAQKVEPNNRDVITALASAEQTRAEHRPTLPSTIGDERQINPFMRWDDADVVQAATDYAGHKPETPDEVLAIIREWKNAS